MIKAAIQLLKDNAFIILLFGLLVTIGNSLNYLLGYWGLWGWLTDFFSTLRFFVSQADFIWNTSAFWYAIGIVFYCEVIFWSFEGAIFVINWFRGK